jgi:hypothetical protein
MPEPLPRFQLDDWTDQVGPEPAWWQDGYPWVVFKARRLFMRERRLWLAEG